jgi:predicted ATPase
MAEAVNQLRNGLDLLCKVSDTAVREDRELDLQIALGQALIATKGWSAPEVGAVFARARELCERLNRPQLLGSIVEGQWSFHFVRGNLKESERDAKEIGRLGEARNDMRLKVLGSSLSGATFLAYGRLIDARKSYENALALWNASDRAFVASAEGRTPILISLFKTLLFIGYIDQARVVRGEALTEARRHSPYYKANTLCFSWHGDWALEDKNSFKTMLHSAEEILALAIEHRFPMATALGKIMRGWCLAKLGSAADVIPDLLEGLKICRDAECTGIVPFLLTRVAEVYWMAGQPARALDRLSEAVDLTENTQERWSEAEIYRLRGSVLLSQRKTREAEESYQRALLVARSQHARFWEIRAATSLARLWRDQGKRDEARELLAPVYGWFTEGFDTLDLKEAKALLEELAG